MGMLYPPQVSAERRKEPLLTLYDIPVQDGVVILVKAEEVAERFVSVEVVSVVPYAQVKI
jgi:hypothetical protein